MKVIYWAHSDDRLRAEQTIQASRHAALGDWLHDHTDNRSSAPVAHIFASLQRSRGALAALVAAGALGKRTAYTPLVEAGELRAARPELRSLLAACAAASDGVYAISASIADELAAFAGIPNIMDLSEQLLPRADIDGRGLFTALQSSGIILFDLTTSLTSTGPPTGIARVEFDLYTSLMEIASDRIIPIVWNRQTDSYLRLPA